MAGQQSPYLQFNPNSFFGGRRIDARPRNVEYEEGTGPRTGLTARRVDPGMGGGLGLFDLSQRYKDLPISMLSREANIRRDQGMMYNPRTGTYQRDSMYNRSGYGYGREPVGDMQPQAPSFTEPQMEWARLAQEKQSGAGALGKIGEKMANVNPPTSGMMGSLGWLPKIAQAATGSGVVAAANPYAGTRSQNIANAKAAGMFDKIRADYNKKNEATGMVMDEEGNITRDPAVAAKNLAAERSMMDNFRRGVETTTSGNTMSFTSPYGRGRVTNYAPGEARPQSMVRDDFGQMVPMNQYLERKNYVQGTQGMTGGTSVLGGNRPAASVLPANPLRKDEGRNLFPNTIDEKAQFDDFRGKLSEAKKRGEEGMAKARGGKAATDLKPLTPSEQRKLTMLEAKYGAQGFASDEMKAIDAERASLYRVLKNLQEEINAGEEMIRPAGGQDPTGFMFGRPLSGKAVSRPLSPQELAARANKVEEITRLIQENEAKSQELGNKRKIPEEAMKEWLELSARANAS